MKSEWEELFGVFEREGLLGALAECADVLDGDGLEKYGVQGWRTKPLEKQREKSERHRLQGDGVDADSGCLSRAHHVLRELIILQTQVEGRVSCCCESCDCSSSTKR